MSRIYDWLARMNAVIGVLALMMGLLAMPQKASAAGGTCAGTCPTIIGTTVCVVLNKCVASSTATTCGCLINITYNPNGTIITCTAVCVAILPPS